MSITQLSYWAFYNDAPMSRSFCASEDDVQVTLTSFETTYIKKYLFSGNTDIQNGNVKLILGLIWSLIAHYQLGASNFPPKKLMLAWLKVNISLYFFSM